MNWEDVTNELLNYLVMLVGVNETIAVLYNAGFSSQEIEELEFSKEDIINTIGE